MACNAPDRFSQLLPLKCRDQYRSN